MEISDAALDSVRTEGFAVIEGFLDSQEVDAVRQGMFEELPRPEEFFADPDRYGDLVSSAFAGIRLPPYSSWAVNRLGFHPDLVDAAERFCGSTDLQLYKIELWAKYGPSEGRRTADYEQEHHRDYGNHSLVVPRADGRWPQLTSFTLLSDVTEEDGPTKVIPRRIGDRQPLIPRKLGPGELTEHEVSVTGPAGTLFLYTTDVLHRGSALTGERSSRFALLADYSIRGNPWMGKISWPGRAVRPGWEDMMTQASVRERDLFGFPPPGHEYWNDQTLKDVGLRYPNMDMSPYVPS